MHEITGGRMTAVDEVVGAGPAVVELATAVVPDE